MYKIKEDVKIIPDTEGTLKIQRAINQINGTHSLSEDGLNGSSTKKALRFLKQHFSIGHQLSSLEKFLETKHLLTINVPYLTQRVNYKYAGRMCNIASLLMVSNYYNEKSVIDERSIAALDKEIDSDQALKKWAIKNGLRSFVNRQRLEQLSSVIARVLTEKTNQEFKFDYLSREEIDTLLQKKDPIIVSTQLIGYHAKKSGTGHYVVIIGRVQGGYIIHDPWGFYGDGYSRKQIGDIKRKGEQVLIPASILFGDYGIKTQKHDSGTGSDKRYRSISAKEAGSMIPW